MRSTAAALLAAALLFPAAARAQPVSSLSGPGPDTWIELHLGGALPQEDDLDVVDPGVAFGGTFGARFTPWLGVEGGLGFLRASGSEAGAKLTVTDLPVTANLRFRGALRALELSVSGGVGLHFASLSSEVPGLLPGETVSRSRSTTAFGFQVGAALGFNLSPTMLVGVAAERSFVEPEFDEDAVRFDMLRLALTLTYHL